MCRSVLCARTYCNLGNFSSCELATCGHTGAYTTHQCSQSYLFLNRSKQFTKGSLHKPSNQDIPCTVCLRVGPRCRQMNGHLIYRRLPSHPCTHDLAYHQQFRKRLLCNCSQVDTSNRDIPLRPCTLNFARCLWGNLSIPHHTKSISCLLVRKV